MGYLKYYGDKVDDGTLDARTVASALIGFDEVFRYFLSQENKAFIAIDFDLPVKNLIFPLR